MAKVRFNRESGISSLSGSIGRLTFRTINGNVYVHERKEPSLPKKATRAQKRLYKRQVIIENCLEILQNEIEDVQEAIRLRNTIKSWLKNLYKEYSPEIRARTKLQKAIMLAYRERFNRFKKSRQNHDKTPMKPR